MGIQIPSNKPKVSVVIPSTLQRASILETVDSLKPAASLGIQVEVVVNNAHPDLVLISKLQAFEFVHVRQSSQLWPTAEASAMSAANSSQADWVWILGDDDLAAPQALERILTLVSSGDADFWLLNIGLGQVVPLDYYRVEPAFYVTTVEEVWGRMGWISITTTLSAFLIKRSVINWEMFWRFHEIQGIYSHSFSLFCMLLGKKVGVTDHVCVDRKEGGSEEVGNSLYEYQTSLGRPMKYIWTTGLKNLMRETSRVSGIPKRTLWRFEESELIKPPGVINNDGTPFQILNGPTINVFWRHFLRSERQWAFVSRMLGLGSVVKVAPVTIKFGGSNEDGKRSKAIWGKKPTH